MQYSMFLSAWSTITRSGSMFSVLFGCFLGCFEIPHNINLCSVNDHYNLTTYFCDMWNLWRKFRRRQEGESKRILLIYPERKYSEILTIR